MVTQQGSHTSTLKGYIRGTARRSHSTQIAQSNMPRDPMMGGRKFGGGARLLLQCCSAATTTTTQYYCLLLVVGCWLFLVVYCLLFVVCCLLVVLNLFLFVCCLLLVLFFIVGMMISCVGAGRCIHPKTFTISYEESLSESSVAVQIQGGCVSAIAQRL